MSDAACVAESVLLGRAGEGRAFRFRSAAVSWRMSRGGAMRGVTAADATALTSVLRAMYPPEIVVISVQNNETPVPEAWREFFTSTLCEVKGIGGGAADYALAAHIEKGGSYLAIYTLASGSRVPDFAIASIRVGGFTYQARHNTVALITLGGGSAVGVANWALPRRTGRGLHRAKATYTLMAMTYTALGIAKPEVFEGDPAPGDAHAPHTSPEPSSIACVCVDAPELDGYAMPPAARGADAAVRAAVDAVRGRTIGDAAALLAECDFLIATGAFESRTIEGRDQLAHAMKCGLCLPSLVDADAKGTCVTSYYPTAATRPGTPGGGVAAVNPRNDVPAGRTARVFFKGKSARTVSCRVVPFAEVTDKPVAAIVEAEVPCARVLSREWRERLGVETRLAVARSIDPFRYYAGELPLPQAAEHLAQLVPLAGAAGEAVGWGEAERTGARRVLDAVKSLVAPSSPGGGGASPSREARLRDETARYIIKANAACGLAASGTNIATALATLQTRDEPDGREGIRILEAREAARCLQAHRALLRSYDALRKKSAQVRRRASSMVEQAHEDATVPGGDAPGTPASSTASFAADGAAEPLSDNSGDGAPSDVSDGDGWFTPVVRAAPVAAATAVPAPPLIASAHARRVALPKAAHPAPPADPVTPGSPGGVAGAGATEAVPTEMPTGTAAPAAAHAPPSPAQPPSAFDNFTMPSPPPDYVQSVKLLDEHAVTPTPPVGPPAGAWVGEDGPAVSATQPSSSADGPEAFDMEGLVGVSRRGQPARATANGGEEGARGDAGELGTPHRFYSPAYYLPPWFTLLWQVARESVEEGRLVESNIEKMALAALGEDEHYDMLIQRGRLMEHAKTGKRERELTHRVEAEESELRPVPKITKWAHDLPSRGDFYSYSCEWHDRSRREREVRKDMEEKRELSAIHEEQQTSRVTEASRQILKSMDYRSPVTHWRHHAVEQFAKKHQQPGPGGVFEPVITELGYKVGGGGDRGHILDRMYKKIEAKNKKLRDKYPENRIVCDADGNPYKFKPTISKEAQKLPKRQEWEQLYKAMFRQHEEKEKKWKKKHIEKFKEDYPFKPIEKNEVSEKILESKARRTPLHKGRYATKDSGLLRTRSRSPDTTPQPKKVIRKDEEILEKAQAMHFARSSKTKMKKAIAKVTDRRDDDFKEALGIGDGRSGAFTPLINKNSERIMKRKNAALMASGEYEEEDEEIVTPEPPPTLHSAQKAKGRSATVSPYHVPKRLQVVTSRGLYSRPRSEKGDSSQRTASHHQAPSPASQYYTPMRSASAAPWLVPQNTPPPYDVASTPNAWETRGPVVTSALPSRQSSATHHHTTTPPVAHARVHAPTPATSLTLDAASPNPSDPYSAIEEHLNTMCGVLDDYLSLEDYASNISMSRESVRSRP